MGKLGIWRLAALLISSLLLQTACNSPQATSSVPVCSGHVTTDVTVDTLIGSPLEDRHLGIGALSAQDSLDKNVPALKNYTETLGLTVVSATANFNGDVRAEPVDGHWCAKLLRVTVRVNWGTTVFMAHELVPGSCPYHAIRDHEEKHINLDHDLLPELKSRIAAAIEQTDARPVWGTTSSSAISRLQTQTQQAAQGAVDQFGKERDARQLRIDTPAEYDRVVALCGNAAFPKLEPHSATTM
jgi:hypothetical protein